MTFRPAACVVVALLGIAPPAMGQARSAAALEARLHAVLAEREADFIATRHDFHQHPEVSGEEVRTSALVAARLRKLGFEVRTGVGGHGVVGLLRGGRPGPVVAFRADMDAVPSGDPDPVEYRSLVPGVRHICGHDIHTTIGLALAEAFQAVQAELPGSLLLIFQPAEERATGARAMLADRVFSLARPAAIYAVHTAPLEVGRIGTEPGPMLAGRDFVNVSLSGTGDLAAAADSAFTILRQSGTLTPQQARGNVPAGFVLAEVQPARPATTGSRVVRATLSIADPAIRASTRQRVETALAGLSRGGVEARVDYRPRAIAGVTNDTLLTRRADARLRRLLGDSAVVRVGVVSPLFSEDFGSFQDEVPGVMYLLGVSNTPKGWVGMPHSPGYVADDAAILVGARALSLVLLDRMVSPP